MAIALSEFEVLSGFRMHHEIISNFKGNILSLIFTLFNHFSPRRADSAGQRGGLGQAGRRTLRGSEKESVESVVYLHLEVAGRRHF